MYNCSIVVQIGVGSLLVFLLGSPTLVRAKPKKANPNSKKYI